MFNRFFLGFLNLCFDKEAYSLYCCSEHLLTSRVVHPRILLKECIKKQFNMFCPICLNRVSWLILNFSVLSYYNFRFWSFKVLQDHPCYEILRIVQSIPKQKSKAAFNKGVLQTLIYSIFSENR